MTEIASAVVRGPTRETTYRVTPVTLPQLGNMPCVAISQDTNRDAIVIMAEEGAVTVFIPLGSFAQLQAALNKAAEQAKNLSGGLRIIT